MPLRTIGSMVLNDNQFARNVRTNGGASREAGSRAEAPASGYYVSLPGHEKVLNYASAGAVKRHREGILRDAAAPKFQGAWQSNGKTYLDASDNIPDRAQAILQGHIQKQIGIYDAANDKTLLMKDHPPVMPTRSAVYGAR